MQIAPFGNSQKIYLLPKSMRNNYYCRYQIADIGEQRTRFFHKSAQFCQLCSFACQYCIAKPGKNPAISLMLAVPLDNWIVLYYFQLKKSKKMVFFHLMGIISLISWQNIMTLFNSNANCLING